MNIGTWLAGFASAFSIKLSSSIDDVVWLAPFLTAKSSKAQRIRNVVIYVSVCLVQTFIAITIAYSGTEVVDWLTEGSKNAWSSEKILTVIAGCLLAVYSVKLTHEWCTDEGDEEGEKGEKDGEKDAEEAKYSEVATAESGASADGSADARNLLRDEPEDKGRKEEKKNEEKGEAEDKRSSSQLFVIAFIGSVDDLTLFVPMLVGKGFDIVQLVAGGFLATSVIVSFCLFIGCCGPIADCLSKIPLALIVVVFATILLSKSFFME